MFPSTLTFLAFGFISAIDDGDVLPLDELEHELDYKNDIFEFLDKKFPNKFDFSILTQIDKEFLIDNYSDIHFAHGPKKCGINKNGLGALLSYTIELIQRERLELTEKGFHFQLEMDPNYFSGRDDSRV